MLPIFPSAGPPTPPVLWRARRRLMIYIFVLLVLAFTVGSAGILEGPGLLVPLIVVLLGMAAGGTVVALRVQTRRWRRRITVLNFEACLNCAYPLSGLPARYACPECGRPYDIDDVRTTWRHHMP